MRRRQFFLAIIFFIMNKSASYPMSSENNTGNMRIVGGLPVGIQEVPYIVRVEHKRGTICTGSIISEDWVLTAGHCADEYGAGNIRVIAGISLLKPKRPRSEVPNSEFEQKGQIRIVSEVVIHPWYIKRRAVKWDFALLKVEKSFTLDSFVGILELGGEQWPQNSNMYSRKCQAVGWGKTGERQPPTNKLMLLNVTAEHGEKACKCLRRYQKKRAVCLTLGTYKGLCGGDSGGPLVCDGKGYGVAHFIYNTKKCGRVLWGMEKPQCGKPDVSSVYSYICPELDWIHKYASNQPKRPKSCKAPKLNVMSVGLILLLLISINFMIVF